MKQRLDTYRVLGKRKLRGILFFVGALAVCAGADVRTWTSTSGETFKGEFISVIGDKVVLRDANGQQRKIPLSRFSENDQVFIELERPPAFNIDFAKKSEQHIWPQREKTYDAWELPGAIDYVFTAKLKQTSSGSYSHELQVEFFAIGEEIDGDNYILLSRQKSTFIPSEQQDQTFTFSGSKVRLYDYEFFQDGRRGQKYGGYLVVVTDSRGKIVAHKTPYNWLFENFDKLDGLPVGKHFNKACVRVHPPRPKSGRQKSG